jgi:hypothetical protein
VWEGKQNAEEKDRKEWEGTVRERKEERMNEKESKRKWTGEEM